MITKLLALSLFLVGTLWALAMAWFHLVMSFITVTVSVLPLPLHFLVGFGAPAILGIGATCVMAIWHHRRGAILALVGYAVLMRIIGPDAISDFVRPLAPVESPRPYTLLAVLLLGVSLTDAAAVLVLCRLWHRAVRLPSWPS